MSRLISTLNPVNAPSLEEVVRWSAQEVLEVVAPDITVLRFPSTVLIHLNSGRSRGLSAPTTLGMWMHPASVTAARQPRPSLVTMSSGSKLALAHLAMTSDVKPLTMSSLSRTGYPAPFVETTATKGDFVLRAPARFTSGALPTEVSVVQLHRTAEQSSGFLARHGAVDIVVQQPRR